MNRPAASAIRLLVFWGPLTVIAFRATIYLGNCASTLASPKAPIVLTYKAKAGFVSIVARSYSVDLRNGIVLLASPQISGPDGAVIAQAKQAVVNGLDVWRGSDQIVNLRIFGAQGRLERLSTGRLEIEDVLPTRHGPPSQTPYHVEIDRAWIEFVDRKDGKRWTRSAECAGVTVDGVGDDWQGSGVGQVSGAGTVSARIQRIRGDGIVASVSTSNAELAEWARHFAPDVGESVEVSSLRLRGSAEVFVPDKGHIRLRAPLEIEAARLRFRQYRAQSAKLRGLFSESGVAGAAKASLPGCQAEFNGSFSWSPIERCSGSLVATASSLSSVPTWLTHLLPSRLSVTGTKVAGWVAWSKTKGFSATGSVLASRIAFDRDSLSSLEGRFAWRSGETLETTVKARHGSGAFANASGFVDFRNGGRLSGIVTLDQLSLAAVSRRFGDDGLSGSGRVTASVEGTTTSPTVEFYSDGMAKYVGHQLNLDLGKFEIRGRYVGRQLNLQDAVVDGPSGQLVLGGLLGADGRLDMNLAGRGLRIGRFQPELSGTSNVALKINGSIRKPVATGRIEGYELRFRKHEAAGASAILRADKDGISLTQLAIMGGATRFDGNVRYAFRDRSLSGSLTSKRLEASEWIGTQVVGFFDTSVPNFTYRSGELSGTALVSGTRLLAEGIRIADARASVTIKKNVVNLDEFTAHSANGTAKGHGTYDLGSSRGTVVVNAEAMDLAELADRWKTEVNIGGRVSAKIQGSWDSESYLIGAQGEFDQLTINDTPLGGGPWQFDVDPKRVRTTVSVGELTGAGFSSLEVQDASFDRERETVTGRIDAHQLRLEDLLQAALPSIPDLTADAQAALGRLGGLVDLGATFAGAWSSPDFSTSGLRLSSLQYDGHPVGALTGALERHGKTWTLEQGTLSGPIGSARMKGSFTEGADVSADLQVNHLNLRALHDVVPSVAIDSGVVSLDLNATGSARSPILSGDLSATGLFAQNKTDESGLNVNIFDLRIGEAKSDGVHAKGIYNFEGFSGDLTASAPFQYPFSIPDGDAEVKLQIKERPLSGIEGLSSLLDPKRTDGTIQGELGATWKSGALDATGSLNLTAGTIGFSVKDQAKLPLHIDGGLKGVQGSVSLKGTSLSTTLVGSSSRGGGFSADASVLVGDLRELIDKMRAKGVGALLEAPVQGHLQTKDLQFRLAGEARSYVAGTLNGGIQLAGTLQAPAVSGRLNVKDVDTVVPPLGQTAVSEGVPEVDPSFDVTVAVDKAKPAHVRSSGADLTVSGSGSLSGKLSSPIARADMLIERGSLRLPGAAIRVENGGTLDFLYQNAASSLYMNLSGRTNLTAQRYSDTTQRYTITLYVTGDLLKQDGLSFVASSDPPDLSSDEILAMLGRTDLITSLGSAGPGGTEARFREALVGYALPGALDPYTQDVARILGLEYLGLEHSSFEETTLTFGKSLGTEFSIHGRRQLGVPPPGLPPVYDLNLVYTPHTLRRTIPRFSFSFGVDQYRPWKFGMEYSLRTAGPHGDAPTPKVQISP